MTVEQQERANKIQGRISTLMIKLNTINKQRESINSGAHTILEVRHDRFEVPDENVDVILLICEATILKELRQLEEEFKNL